MLDRFKNVIFIKKANIYFDGNVTNRNILFADGKRKMLGFMLPGDYEFNTGAMEQIEIISGEMEIILPSKNTWQTFHEDQSFSIPANSSFKLKLNVPVDYCCSYG